MQSNRPSTVPASHGSRTQTITGTPAEPSSSSSDPSSQTPDQAQPSVDGLLRLRGRALQSQRVQWSDETVDNEQLNRKKSKICCIYHKPKAFDESSDESSSDGGDSDASIGSADSRQARSNPRRRNPRHHRHHEDAEECGHGAGPSSSGVTRSSGGGSQVETIAPPPVPNAYEKQPATGGGGSGSGGKGKGKA